MSQKEYDRYDIERCIDIIEDCADLLDDNTSKWFAAEAIRGIRQQILGEERDDDIVEDGFGNAWSAWCPLCGRKTMAVMRPGKVQCCHCG